MILTYLFDDLDLAIEAHSSTLNQRHISAETHFVHVAPCGQIVQGIEDQCERSEPRDVELGIHDVGMVGLQFGVWTEFLRNLLRNLESRMSLSSFHILIHVFPATARRANARRRTEEGGFGSKRRKRTTIVVWTYQGLRLLDMFMSEEELAIEVAQVDCIQVDNVDFAEPGQDEVFEEFAADAACANKEDARLKIMRDVRMDT